MACKIRYKYTHKIFVLNKIDIEMKSANDCFIVAYQIIYLYYG